MPSPQACYNPEGRAECPIPQIHHRAQRPCRQVILPFEVVSGLAAVLGTTLNCLFDDSSTTTTPSRHDRHRKTDLYESIDSMRTQPPRWLAVCVRIHAVMQDRQFNLVSCTLSDLSTRPTTNDAHYLESGIGMRRQMGTRGGHCGFIVSSHSGGTHGP